MLACSCAKIEGDGITLWICEWMAEVVKESNGWQVELLMTGWNQPVTMMSCVAVAVRPF